MACSSISRFLRRANTTERCTEVNWLELSLSNARSFSTVLHRVVISKTRFSSRMLSGIVSVASAALTVSIFYSLQGVTKNGLIMTGCKS